VTFNPKSKKNGFVSVLFTRYILSVREGSVFEAIDFLVSPFLILNYFLFVIIDVFVTKNVSGMFVLFLERLYPRAANGCSFVPGEFT
jgi:predicted choloylglycine hydrolase